MRGNKSQWPFADEPNYVSFTIWDDKQSFTSWLKSDAFKEAHGGGTLFGFIDMLVNSTFTLDGAPKPAFWHGLLPLSTEPDMAGKRVEGGWRIVEADGKNLLDSEAFTVSNRFKIAEGQEKAFEDRCSSALLTRQLGRCIKHESKVHFSYNNQGRHVRSQRTARKWSKDRFSPCTADDSCALSQPRSVCPPNRVFPS